MIAGLLAALELEEVGPGRYTAPHTPDGTGRQVVFGGELLGQAIIATSRVLPDKRVKSVQTVFARGVHTDSSLELVVEVMHEGRSFGSTTVSFIQDGRLCTRALVLTDTAEPDLVEHQAAMPAVGAPDPGAAIAHPLAAPETIILDGVDINDPAAVGPPNLQMWVRFPGAPSDGAIARALLAYATDGWLIGTAMRPHAGIGQSMAHRDISTGVVSHALVFHRDLDVNRWHLIDHSSVLAAGGRCYGTANIFTGAGVQVASFSQEALLRHFSNPTGTRDTKTTF